MSKPIKINNYGDFILQARHVPDDPNNFQTLLDWVVSEARRLEAPIVWLHLEDQHADHIAIAMKHHSFLLHSVIRGKIPYLRLWLKLSDHQEHIVSHSNHCVRVEAVVLHQARDWSEPRVLCVRERYSTDPTFIKLPSGSVDRHEFLECAAKREVLEETDLQAYYEGIIGVWENRFGSHELVTLTFAVRMRLNNDQDPDLININERELNEAFWVPLSSLRDIFANRPEGAWLETPGILVNIKLPSHRYRNWLCHLVPEFSPNSSVAPISQSVVPQKRTVGFREGMERHRMSTIGAKFVETEEQFDFIDMEEIKNHHLQAYAPPSLESKSEFGAGSSESTNTNSK